MTQAIETVKYNDTPAKVMMYPAAFFMLVGMLVGGFISFNGFVMPDYFMGEYVHFGRLRPLHVATVALLWLLSVSVGHFYYYVPRLCGIPLWSPKLAYFSAAIWWPSLIIGIFSFPFGTNYGWEYAELPMWLGPLPIKALVVVAWVPVVINIFMTIATRRHIKMYVTLWYTMGMLIWTTFTFLVGNFGLEYVPGGISRVNMNFFYVHNLVGLIFTPAGVATAYYYVPKISNAPLYSHKLSMIGFWTIAFVYAWIGAHHIIHGPVSQWLQTTAIVFSIWLFIPVWTVVTNFFATMKGQWSQYTGNPAIRFLMMGNIFYLVTCIQGPLQALRNVNEITSKTDWIVAHAHTAVFGAFTFFAIAGMYHAIPVMTGKRWWSKSLGDWHFTLTLIGALLMFGSLNIGGFLKGLTWAQWASGTSYEQFHQNLSQVPFLQALANMHPWWSIRLLSAWFIAGGALLFCINLYNTIILDQEPEKA